MKNIKLLLCGAVVGSIAWLFMPTKAHAATLTLSGGCSIDNAIASANADSDTGGCVGSGGYGDDTIDVPAGTWSFSQDNTITDTLTVTGLGAGTSMLDGQNLYGGLSCENQGSDPTLTVNNLTLQNNGSSDSSMRPIGSQGCNLTISSVEITGMTNNVSNMQIASNAEAFDLTVSIDGLYIHGSEGVGISVFEPESQDGTVTVDITNMTIADMTPYSNQSGGIGFISRELGAINATITNSTINANNSQSLAIMGAALSGSNPGTTTTNIELTNVTIVGHANTAMPAGGLLAQVSSDVGSTSTVDFRLNNVLLADNFSNGTPASCGTFVNSNGGTATTTFTSLGNNLVDDATCNLNASGDQENVSGLLSTLGPLQDNGGFAPTMALLSGSPAIDAGATVLGLTTDQRSIARPQGSAYDIGAYEYEGGNQQQGGGNQQNNGGSSDNGAQGGNQQGNGGGSGNGAQGGNLLANTGENATVIVAVAVMTVFTGLLILKNTYLNRSVYNNR